MQQNSPNTQDFDVDGYNKSIDKSRDEASAAEKTVLLNPDSTSFIAENLVDTTNIATTYYPSTSGMAMDGYRDLSFTGTIGDAAHASSLTLEVSNWGGATATDWMQVYFFDAKANAIINTIPVSSVAAIYFACCADKLNFAFFRFLFTTADPTNTLRLTIRRSY